MTFARDHFKELQKVKKRHTAWTARGTHSADPGRRPDQTARITDSFGNGRNKKEGILQKAYWLLELTRFLAEAGL
jgi:hypothetical protein